MTAGALALASMATSVARGDSQRFRFAYHAAPGCPDERTFVGRVALRIDPARLTSHDDASAATMSIDVTARETESSGRLEFVDASGETVVRTVGGRTCDEIVSGLALIAALAIEARTMAEPAIEAPAAPSAALVAPAAPVTPRRPLAEVSAERPSASGTPVRFGAAVSGGVDSSSTPGAALAVGIYGEVTWRAPLRFVRLGARRVAREGSVSDRSASFTRWAARFEDCPISLVLAPRLELPACAAFEVGQLAGAGNASITLPNPESDRILWTSLDASAGLRWEPGRFWVVQARGAVDFPLTRRKFVFRGPEETVFDVPTVGWGVGIDLGAHFP